MQALVLQTLDEGAGFGQQGEQGPVLLRGRWRVELTRQGLDARDPLRIGPVPSWHAPTLPPAGANHQAAGENCSEPATSYR